MNALTLQNVSYTYPGGTSPVVKNASYEFEAGKLYAVVGPSGSGKSTLLVCWQVWTPPERVMWSLAKTT